MLNPADPLSDGLRAVWAFSGRHDTTVFDMANNYHLTRRAGAGTATTATGPQKVFTPEGLAYNADGSDDNFYAQTDLGITGYPMTMMSRFIHYPGEFSNLFSLCDVSTDTNYIAILGRDTDVARMMVRAGGTEDATSGTSNIADGRPHTVIAVFRSATNRELYVDGVSEATDATSRAYPSGIDNVGIFALNDTSSSYYESNGFLMAAAWNRDLVPHEIRLLQTDPYRMIRPSSSRRVVVSLVGSGYAGSTGGKRLRPSSYPSRLRG